MARFLESWRIKGASYFGATPVVIREISLRGPSPSFGYSIIHKSHFAGPSTHRFFTTHLTSLSAPEGGYHAEVWGRSLSASPAPTILAMPGGTSTPALTAPTAPGE
jgi:hypothetical protein